MFSEFEFDLCLKQVRFSKSNSGDMASLTEDYCSLIIRASQKECIQEFFSCMGNLSLDDAPILKTTRSYADAISALVLKLESIFIRTHPTLQRLFFELPDIKNPRAKKLATLVLMNEFDYILREAREIYDFYGMNREKPVIDEILYNSEYALRHFLGNNKTLMRILKRKSPF